MYQPFREHHIFSLLNEYEQESSLPLDLFLGNYFRAHKALGSKDRGFIAETVYALIRWKGLLDFLSSPDLTWEKRLEIFSSNRFEESKKSEEIPLHIRLSFPKLLFEKLVASHGIETVVKLAATSNLAAPTTVRVNTLKTNREELLMRWSSQFDVIPCEHAPDGIMFRRRINFYDLQEFKDGFFEIQDEGSQLLAQLVQVEPGQQVMDYCAGAGGKTLAFAPQMKNLGQIHLHDIRKKSLDASRKRLRRAGVQNAQIIYQDEKKLKKLKKKMDWVLVDAPCTGTGTMRRNPDMKWKFDLDLLQRLVSQQRVIFEKALSFLKPDGRIVFSTCSVLNEENEEQMDHFVKTYGLEVTQDVFKELPREKGMDGFFGVVFRRK
jgi:16S rRNA (cytosine967-C5)-methyltransferase